MLRFFNLNVPIAESDKLVVNHPPVEVRPDFSQLN
jgi:hypothetical protein